LAPIWILLCALIGCAGCRDTASSDLIGISSSVQSVEASKDAIEEAFRDIPKMILLERRVAVGEVTRQLNSWSTRQPPEPDWKPSELIEGIPSPLRKSFWGMQLASMQFGEPHCDYLYQCQRMHSIVEWVLARPYRDPLFAPWLEKKKAELGQEEGTRLEQALKLFDWTIRNIMMEGDAKAIETLPTNPQLPGCLIVCLEFLALPEDLRRSAYLCFAPTCSEPFGYVDVELGLRGVFLSTAPKIQAMYFRQRNLHSSRGLSYAFSCAADYARTCPKPPIGRCRTRPHGPLSPSTGQWRTPGGSLH
jgi:hypothetical protein